ncbi:HNH endonuclease [Holdemanella porci]|uniref:HNH endonuclease n=1 Tax=Holdemanella porci TaxID=2652276 RepID=UPI003AB39586
MWKFIRDSNFYQVNEYGNIRRVSGKIMRKDGKSFSIKESNVKTFVSKDGYEIVPLKLDIRSKLLVHRVVLEAFCPVENMINLDVNHIDGNKLNNNLNNLEWCTKHENMQHAMRIGLFNPQNRCGEKHPMCKLSSDDVEEIKRLIKSGNLTQHKIAEIYNVSDCTISEIKTGRKRRKG